MREIPLTKGFVAIVDDEDFEDLMKYKWTAAPRKTTCYARRNTNRGENFYMHREIMRVSDSKIQVDHANHNGLDNRKSNLRIANSQLNQANRLSSGSEYGFRGVFRNVRDIRFLARIKVNGTEIRIGRFDDPKDAARAYDEAALKYFGEFATTNLSMGLL